MATKYVISKTAQLYETAIGRRRHMVLIFGDEVRTHGAASNGRFAAEFRGRSGFIREDSLGGKPALELYFIDVGQGDSTFVVTPGRKKILIDGGMNRRALGFLAWKYRLDRDGPPIDIDLLVLTHADGDHLGGLTPVVCHPRINVRRIVHNGIATFRRGAFDTRLGDRDSSGKFLVTRHQGLSELDGFALTESFDAWSKAVAVSQADYAAVDSTGPMLDVGDPHIALEVLGPCLDQLDGRPVYRYFGDDGHTINGHSVVLRLKYRDASFLFAGDLNIEGSKHLMSDPAIKGNLDAHVLKTPHHGSHEFHPPFLEAVSPQISVISSGDDPDHGHPRASFIGALGLSSRSNTPLLFSTEISATFVEADEPSSTDNDRADTNTAARRLFKRRLHGMINVRTDGRALYAARRVAAGYWWESYGPMPPASRPSVFGEL